MRIKIISIFLLYFSFSIYIYGESVLEGICNYIVAGDFVIAEKLLDDFEHDSLSISNDSLKSDFYYVKGVLLNQKGDSVNAMASFVKSYEIGKAINYNNDDSHFDTMVRIMYWYYGQNDFDACAKIGMDAIRVPDDVLSRHPATPYIFGLLSISLSSIMKYAAVPQIIEKGTPYIEDVFSSSDEYFYELPLCEAYAYLCMLKPEKADSVLNQLKNTYLSSCATLQSIEMAFDKLNQDIKDFRQNSNWKQRAMESIQHIENDIISVNPQTQEGSKMWRQFLRMIRHNLEYLYLDPNDVEDEKFWSWHLAQLIIYFNVFCDGMPGRSCESYNNILLKKNFLEYHYKKINKKPCTWESVANMLDCNEAAIEISQMPNEFLVVRNGINEPLSIPIDSLMLDSLTLADIHDAVTVSELYGVGKILHRLWGKVDQYLDGVETIYLSTSHVFGRFNYMAIPLNTEMTVSDKYNVINVLSTADIEFVKKNQTPIVLANALLYGGIDYDVCKEQMLSEAEPYNDFSQKQVWSLIRGLPVGTRRNLEPLKWSMNEVHSIDSTLRQNHVDSRILSGASANEESIKALCNSTLDLIHFSTHGFMLASLFASDKGEEVKRTLGNYYQTILSQSGLFLAGSKATWMNGETVNGTEDGILTSKEIAKLNLDGVKLVVLSACDTGLGDECNLTGAQFGVHYAFKIAGVEKLLVCLWQVDDEATSYFMNFFYGSLIETGNCNDALLNAQKEMINIGYENPYYWAPFIIIE